MYLGQLDHLGRWLRPEVVAYLASHDLALTHGPRSMGNWKRLSDMSPIDAVRLGSMSALERMCASNSTYDRRLHMWMVRRGEWRRENVGSPSGNIPEPSPRRFEFGGDAFVAAALRGRLDMLELLYSIPGIPARPFHHDVMRAAVRGGCLRCIDFAFKRTPASDVPSDLLNIALRGGILAVCVLIDTRVPNSACSQASIDVAISKADPGMSSWILENLRMEGSAEK